MHEVKDNDHLRRRRFCLTDDTLTLTCPNSQRCLYTSRRQATQLSRISAKGQSLGSAKCSPRHLVLLVDTTVY